MSTTFVINGVLPGMNDIIGCARTHWSRSAAQKKGATLRCADAFKGGQAFNPPIAIFIEWFEPTLKRDLDNVTAGVKFVLDGMVAAGKIANDSRRFIKSISHQVSIDRNNPRIEVTVKELNA